jgi:hypothetical protein
VERLDAIRKELTIIANGAGNVPAYQLTLELRELARQMVKLVDIVEELAGKLPEDRMFEESEQANGNS